MPSDLKAKRGRHLPRAGGQPGGHFELAGNLVHVVLEGGVAPATAGNPRPFGMPPFATEQSDAEVAQLLSFASGRWGNRAQAVLAVSRYRSVR